VTSGATLRRRAAASSTAAAQSSALGTIPATLSIRTNLLVVSPLAVWFSFAILLFLALSTFFVFIEQLKFVKLLPRDVDSPASLFGFVYASKKLQAWTNEKADLRQWDEGAGTRLKWSTVKRLIGKDKKRAVQEEDDGVMASMGSFDGDVHWGVEIGARTNTEQELYQRWSSASSEKRQSAGTTVQVSDTDKHLSTPAKSVDTKHLSSSTAVEESSLLVTHVGT
jgi:hypothetical protein